MLSLILRRDFFEFGQTKIFFGKLLRPYVGVNSDFLQIFAVLGTLKIVEKIEFLTRMLRPLCAR